MPVYVYRCESCGSQFEKRQSFSDAPLTECERCQGRLHKQFYPAAIIYKGSGFYSTDHHSKSGSVSKSEGNGHNGEGEKVGSEKPASEAPAESKSKAGSDS